MMGLVGATFGHVLHQDGAGLRVRSVVAIVGFVDWRHLAGLDMSIAGSTTPTSVAPEHKLVRRLQARWRQRWP